MADRETNSFCWGGTVPRWIAGEDIGSIENPLYIEITAEIAQRAAA